MAIAVGTLQGSHTAMPSPVATLEMGIGTCLGLSLRRHNPRSPALPHTQRRSAVCLPSAGDRARRTGVEALSLRLVTLRRASRVLPTLGIPETLQTQNLVSSKALKGPIKSRTSNRNKLMCKTEPPRILTNRLSEHGKTRATIDVETLEITTTPRIRKVDTRNGLSHILRTIWTLRTEVRTINTTVTGRMVVSVRTVQIAGSVVTRQKSTTHRGDTRPFAQTDREGGESRVTKTARHGESLDLVRVLRGTQNASRSEN